jgi:hypothetical protein
VLIQLNKALPSPDQCETSLVWFTTYVSKRKER